MGACTVQNVHRGRDCPACDQCDGQGTVKYNTDKHTKEEWIEHGLQDSMDAAIYPYFVRDEQWHGTTPTMPQGWAIQPYVKSFDWDFETGVFTIQRNGLPDITGKTDVSE